jgi:branched-chain amino acid transport system permease protein
VSEAISLGPRRWLLTPRTGGLLALATVIGLLPLALANNYFYEVAIVVAFNAIVCVGLNLLIGYAGQISLGHAGFLELLCFV